MPYKNLNRYSFIFDNLCKLATFWAQALSYIYTENGLQWFHILQEVKSMHLPKFLHQH